MAQRKSSTPFDDAAGWLAIPAVLDTITAARIAADCDGLAAALGTTVVAVPGDKAAGGTQHLGQLLERLPAIAALLAHPALVAAVEHVLEGPGVAGDVAYRNPRPGYGGQRLHADALPQASRHSPATVVTAIVALVDFTDSNGATRVVPGSHLRPDLQRLAGGLDAHPDEIILTGPAGTAFVFSGHLLHSGTMNRSSAPRPCLQVVWRIDE